MEIFSVENLTFTYPERERPALSRLTLGVGRGEFVALCGPSGCGKTTLLRQLKPALAPHGVKSGEVRFEGRPLEELSQRDRSARIGFVMQSPDNQLVTDKVWHELAFGLESLGLDTASIRLRVAEMASFFGIQSWFYKDVAELSGGQKQLLNLASIMAMQPSALILDEPTSQLDPIAAGEFLAMVGKINRELGVTVILTEHRLEEVFPLCDRAVVLDGGELIADGAPREVGLRLRERGHGMFLAMPTAMRVWAGVRSGAPCPLTVRDGAAWLAEAGASGEVPEREPLASRDAAEPAVRLDGVWFKYDKDAPDVVKGLSLDAYPGELFAILGGNGAGKTTALSLMSRLNRPYRGRVLIGGAPIEKLDGLFDGLLGVLPQNPQSLFVKKTVGEDLLEILSERGLPKEEKRARLSGMAALCRLDGLLDRHPYDLSGGEQQRAALAKVLLLQPRILLLDEPTKGLDAEFKRIFAGILKKLTSAGAAVVMVSHDVEFCAEHADRCALFFDGSIVSAGAPREFFCGNSFYTTSANRMARGVLPGAVTVNDVISALGGDIPPSADIDGAPDVRYSLPDTKAPDKPREKERKLTVPRRIWAGISAAALIAAIVYIASDLARYGAFISGGDVAVAAAADAAAVWGTILPLICLAVSAMSLTLALTWKRDDRPFETRPAPEKRKLSGRTAAAAAMILLAIPLTIFIGYYYLGDRKYYFISLLIIIETMLPFALVFESRKPQARELVTIAVLCAIAVAGRVAFFMLPQFKPVIAVVIISGVAFGGETGFLTGAMTALVSNIFFGQGPWTPWQMFSFGIIGFLAGVLFRKGLLRRSQIPLAIFGALAALVIYGGLMNPAMVLMYRPVPTRALIFAAYLQGLPFDLVHAAATSFFLLVIARPMLEKLDRIKVKYGLID
ncbi:MAG: ATP-binding cassette domain-containing protein [Oscillospiraceae bacterium]|jgi:energy-coupling factor transport system ATP-binding protein|nr:ATP-binding cassette domain-containing protein [Oscillospiraceae bacterium]